MKGSPLSTGPVRVEGGRLYAESAGDGPAVVLIHPGLWDSRTWDPQFAPFAEHHRVVRYDVRGYGRSSRPAAGQRYSHVSDLLAIMDAQDVDHAVLVGCSMGGAIAVDAALTAPERVTALVLVAPGLGGFDATPEEEEWWAVREAPIAAALHAGDLAEAQRLRLEVWAPLGIEDEGGRTIKEIAFDNIHELRMDESGEEGLEPPAALRLHEILVPTLILAADHDPPDMQRLCRFLAEGIRGSRLVRIPDTDHVLNVRRPAAFNEVVLGWLGEVG